LVTFSPQTDGISVLKLRDKNKDGVFPGTSSIAENGADLAVAVCAVVSSHACAYREAISKTRDAVSARFGSEPFYRGAAEQALTPLRLHSQQGQEVNHHSIADAAVRATAEQQLELARDFRVSDP
jgi:hypothetical protein